MMASPLNADRHWNVPKWAPAIVETDAQRPLASLGWAARGGGTNAEATVCDHVRAALGSLYRDDAADIRRPEAEPLDGVVGLQPGRSRGMHRTLHAEVRIMTRLSVIGAAHLRTESRARPVARD